MNEELAISIAAIVVIITGSIILFIMYKKEASRRKRLDLLIEHAIQFLINHNKTF